MLNMPKYDAESLSQRAKGRIGVLPRRLGVEDGALAGARILEVGCGSGECTAAAIDAGADAIGIDPYPRWDEGPYFGLAQEGKLLKIDASDSLQMAPLGKFDFVQSYTVFEHIDRPFEALANVYDCLKPGGRAFLSFNLHLGASASHLFGHLPDLPWIHLTHTEEEARAIMRQRFNLDRGFSWVNKWKDRHYIDACKGLGFNILSYWFTRKPPTDEFYQANIDKLGMYDKKDLSKNFMYMRLEKPALQQPEGAAPVEGAEA